MVVEEEEEVEAVPAHRVEHMVGRSWGMSERLEFLVVIV